MTNKEVVSPTGLEDAEKVTVAFLVAVRAAEQGGPTLTFLTKEAIRLAIGTRNVTGAGSSAGELDELTCKFDRLRRCRLWFDDREDSLPHPVAEVGRDADRDLGLDERVQKPLGLPLLGLSGEA